MEDLHTVFFGNPVFEVGETQSTCRLGKKWFNRLSVGDVFEIKTNQDTNTEPDADVALVTGITYDRFCDLPIEWLTKEHDPDCRTSDTLAEEMNGVYGADFHREAECTMILFRPQELPEDPRKREEVLTRTAEALNQ